MNNTRPVVVFGTKSDQNDNFLYVKEEDFQILAGAESFGIPLEHLMKIEKSVISSKTFLEHFSYDDFSFWWFLHPTVYPEFKKIINFIERFQKFLDDINPSKVIISDNFSNYDLIEQICLRKNIVLEKNFSPYIKNKIYTSLKNDFQGKRYQKIYSNKIKTRKSMFLSKFKSMPDLKNKIIFAIPTIYHRQIINHETGESYHGEYIQQQIIDHVMQTHDVVGIDLDYTFKGDFHILKNRLDSKMNWFPAELILSKNDKNKFNDFLNRFKNIISDRNFQNLFEFKGISLWSTISPVFKMMSFSPYLPSYYDFLVSLDNLFKEKKPKMIFLSYETGPYGLAILLAAKKNGIKTVGVAHAAIDKYNPMYSYDQIRDENKLLGFPIPDIILVHGEFSKNTLITQGYPSNQIIVYGNSSFFNLNELKNSLEQKNLFKKFDIEKNQKVILYGTEFLQEFYSAQGKYNYNSLILKKLLQHFANNDQFLIIVKPHPNENTLEYEKIIKQFSANNFKIIQGDLFELIHISSLVLSVFSNIMTDALCFEKPVIRVTFDNIKHTVPYEEFEVILSTNLEDMITNITTLLNNNQLQIDLKKNLPQFLKEQNNIPVQNPESIIENLIKNYVKS